jgi:hypothetical protein
MTNHKVLDWGKVRFNWEQMKLELDKGMKDAPIHMDYNEAVAWANGYEQAIQDIDDKWRFHNGQV